MVNGKGGDGGGHVPMRKHDPIAAALKRLHDQVVAEPLPKDFLEMLDRIDQKRDPA